MEKVALLAALTVLLSSSAAFANHLVDYENPVRTSAEDEIKSLPNLNDPITFRQYSGYLKADQKGSKFLHYWFVEAAEDPANKPVLLWLNGGPGCSSMEGLFSELGPFALNSDGTEVSLRKYSWNKLANVIFLESPAGVGFSYSKKLLNFESDDKAAMENYLALKSFFEKFPQYKGNSLFLSGESYAGVYLPTLGVLIDADKDFNLKGLAIGNGYLDAKKLSESLIFFGYHHGLLGKTTWDEVSAKCCGGKPPARANCVLGDNHVPAACSNAISDKMEEALSEPGMNPYNMYGDCPTSKYASNANNSSSLTRWHVDKQLRAIVNRRHQNNDHEKPFEILKLAELAHASKLGGPPCFDGDNMITYLNTRDVRRAVHIPDRVGRWNVCNNLNYGVKYPIRPGGLAPQIRALIASPRKLSLLVFNGDTDLVCNALGDEWFVDDLGRKLIADYQPWKVNKQIAGWVKHYDGITFATVRGAGHMVPEFRPREAYAMISIVLNSTSHNVYL